MAKHSIGSVSMVNFSTVDEPPKDKIKMLRAVELLNSGYRTEAVLVAFAVLDKVVQETLITLMERRGWIIWPYCLVNQRWEEPEGRAKPLK